MQQNNVVNENIRRIIRKKGMRPGEVADRAASLTDEEAALIYLYRSLDERGRGGVMNYAAHAYTQLTRESILQSQRENREEAT